MCFLRDDYLYFDNKLMWNDFLANKGGTISTNFHGLEFANINQYQFNKWLNLNIGLQHYFNFLLRTNNNS